MDVKKLVVAAIAAFIVMFLLAYAWHEVLLADFYADAGATLLRPAPDMTLIFAGHAVLALLMAWAYPIGYRGGSAMAEGFRFGAFCGLLATLPLSLIFSGIWNYPLNATLVDSAWHVVEQGIGGVVIAKVYGGTGN